MDNPPQTKPGRTLPRRVTFPLFTKIMLGFALIIVFMMAGSLFVLFQLKDSVSSKEAELSHNEEINSISQDILTAYEKERNAAEAYILTKDLPRFQEFTLRSAEFTRATQRLLALTDTEKIGSIVRIADVRQAKYSDGVVLMVGLVQKDPGYSTLKALESVRLLSDSLNETLHSLNEQQSYTLRKAYKLLPPRITVAINGGLIILLLSLTIAIVVAIMLARTIIRPIHALKMGTERVGEGKFETVPVTTNDEIADLTSAFNGMSAKLRELDEMRMQMMSEISHEMRSPLQVIKAGCHMITHTKDSPSLSQKQIDAVGMIHQAANRINSFVNSFLDVAKMEAGLMTFQFESTDLLEMMTPLIHEAQLIGQARQVVVEFFADQVPKLPIDRERMSQAITNLLSNALKYTPDKGSIMVRVAKTTGDSPVNRRGLGCVKIDVTDTGVGIPEEDLGKLFNKFYQAANVPVVNQMGSGLGLALVKHVTEAHGGKVKVTSQLNVGSTFSIVLPI